MKKTTKKPKESPVDEYKMLWQRTLADFENYKRRVESEKSLWTNQAKAELMSSLIPLLDNLALMADHTPEELKENSWVKGVDIIASQIEQTLEDEGISKIKPNSGDFFDPKLHEAISQESSNVEEGAIIKVQKPGYMIADRLIRPAQVITSSGPNQK